MKKVLLIGFGIVAVGELVGLLLDSYILQAVCKPLIMITLGIYYVVSVEREHRSTALIAAILFSLFGDILLLLAKTTESYFVLGLASFLVAHVFYIFAYRQHRGGNSASELQGVQRIRLAFPVVLAGTGLVVVLYPLLGELRVPVVLYAVVLVTMALQALFRFGRTVAPSFWLVFAGALLFMLSDCLIAINKFMMPVDHAELWIMSTYMVGQFFIVRGLLEHRGE
jgi:uncharacterized membrane protein YhhN